MSNQVKQLFERIRKLFATGEITNPDFKAPQIKTQQGQIVKETIRWPYGFTSWPEEGTVLVMFKGGDQGAAEVLYVSSRNGEPSLEKGDAALWSKAGAAAIAKQSGKLAIYSNTITLKAWLDELITICSGINTVPTSGTNPPQTLNPLVVTQLEALKLKTAQLLED